MENWSPINPDFHTPGGAEDDEDGVNDNTQEITLPELNLITFEDVPELNLITFEEVLDREDADNMEEPAEVAIHACPFDVTNEIPIDEEANDALENGDNASEDDMRNEIEEEHDVIAEQVNGAEIFHHEVDFQAVVFEQHVQDDVDIVQVRNKLKRSAPVKKRPEHWVVRPKGPKVIRKSRRLASIKCRERIRTIAVQLENEDEFDDIQIDDHNDQECDDKQQAGIPQVDGNYTLQNQDVFSANDIAYLSSEILRQTPAIAYSLAHRLHLDVPADGALSRNRVYFLPPDYSLTRFRVFSISDGSLSQLSTPTRRPSAWRRQLRRLRGFLDKILPGRS